MNNDNFTVLVCGGGRCCWVSMYCIFIAFKMTEWVEQWICIKFCIKLEHSSVKTIQMIQKATAMDNWWLAASSQQHSHSRIMSPAQFFGETSNHPGDLTPLQPKFGSLWLLAFLQAKITFEKEEISDHQWDSGKYDGAADVDWDTCVRSQGAYSEGDWGIILQCTMFLVSCIFFSNLQYLFSNLKCFFLI